MVILVITDGSKESQNVTSYRKKKDLGVSKKKKLNRKGNKRDIVLTDSLKES